MNPRPADYLKPYHAAIQRHGDRFGALLWASPTTQRIRFEQLTALCELKGQRVLDAGCGRADLLEYLIARKQSPAEYVGLEAMPELALAAQRKRLPDCRIVEADFVLEPHRLLTGSDVIIFCGSLNTLPREAFYAAIGHAYNAARRGVVFNFLSSQARANEPWLTWHRPAEVIRFAGSLGARVELADKYLEGDCTISMLRKERA